MIAGLKRSLISNYINYRGWSTKKRILVIESDDWGSIRTPSKEVFEKFVKAGLPVKDHYFVKNDCLESNDDLELLFGVLSSNRDCNGNPAVITADAVVANPDFARIAESGRQSYFYEPITETYKSYPNHNNVMALWKKHGIGENMLYPQYHGREHVNVRKWMHALNAGSPAEDLAFENKALLNLRVPGDNDHVPSYMAAFDYEDKVHQKEIEDITRDGLDLFEQVFGFRSLSFVASSSVMGDHMNPVLYGSGVRFNQCGRYFLPKNDGNSKLIHKFWGDQADGITFWRRNVMFEPSRNPNEDWVSSCMASIETAFRWGKPAVLNSHRVNYSGGISVDNRDNTLRLLDDILKAVAKRWPNVEFMNSAQLGAHILETRPK